MKVLFMANFGMGLYKFRKELLEELMKQNHEVYITLPYDGYVPKLEELGCKFIDTQVDRRGANPIKDLLLLFSYIKLIKRTKPDVVLTYTVKPNVYGGIACRITKTPYMANVTGLGTSIENKGLMQKVTLGLYKIGLKGSMCVFFQNKSNMQYFTQRHIVKNKLKLIPGSGVNLNQHTYEKYPQSDEIVKFLFIGRIMKDKGIDELLLAAEQVKKSFQNVQFDLAGFCEEGYYEKLKKYEEEGIIKYHGQQEDIHSFIKSSHAVILPSYHEGTANVLLEAASTGRPVLASKVAGCIETFDDGLSGLGFEVRNVKSLVDAIMNFLKLPNKEKEAMGLHGRSKMEKEYDRKIVVSAYIKEISRLEEKENELI